MAIGYHAYGYLVIAQNVGVGMFMYHTTKMARTYCVAGIATIA